MSAKPTLYTFPRSTWSACVLIARHELGLTSTIDTKQLNFLRAENMSPEYISMTPSATVPALSVPNGHVCRDTTEAIDHMVRMSAVRLAPRTDLTRAVHDRSVDSKFMVFAARDEDELAAKAARGPVMLALTSRLRHVRAYAAVPAAAPYRAQYAAKIAYIERLLAFYTRCDASSAALSDFFAASRANHACSRALLCEALPARLRAAPGPFVAGAQPGIDDLHVVGWVVHAAHVAGAQRVEEMVRALEAYYGAVPDEVARYLQAWAARESFRKTYVGGVIW